MIKRFATCTNGAIALMTALLMTVFLGVAGLSIELGLWYTIKRAMQTAADAGAIEAAISYGAGNTSGYGNRALAVVAQNGWLNGGGSSGAKISVTVNTPPEYGYYASSTYKDTAFEVLISRPQPPILAWAVGYSTGPTISAHAVALLNPGNGCVLILDATSTSSFAMSGGPSAKLTAENCGVYLNDTANTDISGSAELIAASLTTGSSTSPCPSIAGGTCDITGKTTTNVTTSDPYASRSFTTPPTTPAATLTAANSVGAKTFPAGSYKSSTLSAVSGDGPYTFTSGTYFDGLSLTGVNVTFGSSAGSNVFYFSNSNLTISGSGTSVTFEPGIYYFEGNSSLTVNGTSASLSGSGVTIILTEVPGSAPGSASGKVDFAGSGTISLTAPTGNTTLPGVGTEDTAGLVIFEDRNAATSATTAAVTIAGTIDVDITGAIYVPKEEVNISGSGLTGSATTCTQLVAYAINFSGTAEFQNGCTGTGTASFGSGSSNVSMVE